METTLHSRYIAFLKSVKNSKKSQLKLLLESCRSDLSCQTGQNIAYLLNKYDIEDLESLFNSVNDIKVGRVNPLMENEEWKPQLLEELSLAKLGFLDIVGIEPEQIETLIEVIATS